jgi:ubiquinol-cytochrome c reductase core subunit 2
MTAIKLNHELSMAGGLVDCSATRDFLSYELHASRENLSRAIYYSLTQMAQPKFFTFELKESNESLIIDHGALRENYAGYVLEMLHRAAYRTSPLANSLYAPKRMIGKHSAKMLESFAESYLVSGNAALVGVGVDHELLTSIAKDAFPLRSGSSANTTPAKYGGGELRKDKGGHIAAVAFAAEGASLKDPKTAAVQAVLGALLGVGPQVKWSDGGRSRLGKAVQGATSNPFFVTTFNFAYVDSGLFGIQYFGNHNDSSKIAKAVIGEFRKASKENVNDAELKSAQARVKYHLLAQSECGHNVIEDLAVQTMARPGSYVSPSEFTKLVDSVTAGDVQEAAKKMLSSKLSMAALGNLAHTPYLDEL